MTTLTKLCAYSGVGLCTVLMLGCYPRSERDYSKVELVDISGTVTLDDSPLANAVVTFEAEDGQFSYALTDADGHYSLRFDSRMSGVTPGEKTVQISTTRKILGLNTAEGGEAPAGEASTEGEQDASQIELVPARYNKKSELKRTVKSGEDRTFDFDLKSEPESEV